MDHHNALSRTAAGGAALATASLVAAVAGVVLWAAHGGDGFVESYTADVFVAATSFGILGAYLARRRPLLSVTWLCVAIAAFEGFGLLAHEYAVWALGREAAGGAVASWAALWLWAPGFVIALAVLPLVFPDGHLPSRRWAVAVFGAIGTAVLMVVPVAIAAWPVRGSGLLGDEIPTPLGWQEQLVALGDSGWVVLPVFGLVATSSLIVRFLRSGEGVRQQIGLVAAATAISLLLTIGADRLWPSGGSWVGLLAVPLPVAAIGVAVMRYGLWDLDVVLNRTLVFVGLSTFVAIIYAVVVTGLTRIIPSDRIPVAPIAGAAVIAALFHPLQVRLQRGVDRLLYGERGDPYAVLTAITAPLASAAEPRPALDAAVARISRSLKLPYVAVECLGADDAPGIFVAHGVHDGGAQRAFPLEYEGEQVGRLLVGRRAGTEGFSRREVELLGDVSRHLSVTVKAAQLAEALQRSRAAVVSAREEERRRLRRDLHDRLAAPLTGIAFGIDAARRLGATDAHAADRLHDDLVAQTHASIGVVRELMSRLRPAALDEVGLIAAIEHRARQLLEPAGVELELTSELSDAPLEAAVESAAFHIVGEALTNVVKHAGASRCWVEVRSDTQGLHVVVRDDGSGYTGPRPGGLGLAGMAERAAELGGSVALEGGPGGTSVTVVLPS